MGDVIKRLFHKRYRSTDKNFKPLQSFPYQDARPGPPPRRGSLPLRGNAALPPNDSLCLSASRANPPRTRRSASLGSTYAHPRPNRLRKAASDTSRRARPGDLLRLSIADHGDIPPASPPLPGTAVTSDEARYWRDMDAHTARLDRQLSAGAEGRYGEDVADRVLAEYFPKPPGGPVNSEDELENVPNGSATLSVPSKNRSLKERGSYTLADGEELPVRVENTQSRLFLEDSDDEHAGDSSKEHGHKRSHSSLKRKKGQYSHSRYAPGKTRPIETFLPSGNALTSVAAVTHQTIYPEIHHIREERIFREVHTHDVFHRILPIVDIEVLPARHFVPVEDGGLREIPEEEVPGRALNHQARNWLVAELVSRRTGNDEGSIQPRQFSAREFPGTEGDERRYTTEDGFERTETTWVHPPTIETGARDSGQSEPLYVLPPRPRETPIGSREGEEASLCSRKSLKNLARCVHDCPFDECAEFEAQAREARRGKSG